MITNFNAIHWQLPTHFRMNRLDNFFFERSAAHVRLVRHDNEQKARLFQTATRLRHFGKNLKFAQTCRRIRQPIALQRTADDPVTVEENGWSEFVGNGGHGILE